MTYNRIRAVVMGLGGHGGGVAAARFLAARGAVVTVTDVAGEKALRASLRGLAGCPVASFRLGEHRVEDFRRADLVVVNPAVRPGDSYVEAARCSGARITSEIELFLDHCPSSIVAVTGTNGKSTTAAMIATAGEAAGRRPWLGGNIGRSLLPELDNIRTDDLVVLELSSFQLHWLSEQARLPSIAVFTGCTPNHLDWHHSFADYKSAKRRLLERKSGKQTVIVDPQERCFAAEVDQICAPLETHRLPQLRLVGEHNRRNAAQAATAAVAAGCDPAKVLVGLSQFRGLPHRLETVAVIRGRTFVNDSQSTTPESTIAALKALGDRKCWLLAGGADKGAAVDLLAQTIAKRAAGTALFGATAAKIAAALREAEGGPDRNGGCRRGRDPTHPTRSGGPTFQTDSLATALKWCWRQSVEGDVILLSPACSSQDQYYDCSERAADFVAHIEQIRDECRHPSTAERML